MKKRYLITPFLLIVIAAVWNVTLRYRTPDTSADTIQRYLHPQVKDDRHPIEVYQFSPTDGDTENDILTRFPIPLYPEDKVRFLIDPRYGIGTIVHVERALPVTIHDGKKIVIARTWADTVGEILDDLHRELGDLDKANYQNSDPLALNMTIEITRVAKTTVTVKEVVPFETENKDDPTLDRGKTKVAEEGKNGERIKIFEVIREDGEEVSRALIKNEVTKEPKKKIVFHGTKVKIGKTTTGKVTWYDLCCTKVASTTFKKGTVLRLTNLNTGKQIEVTVDDTGEFGPETVVDLHPDLFKQLGGTPGQGVIQRVRAEEILNP